MFDCRPNAVIVTRVAAGDVGVGVGLDGDGAGGGAGVGFGLDGVTVTTSEIFNT